MRIRITVLFLLLAAVAMGDNRKADLKPTFKCEGQTYTIDEVTAHRDGAIAIKFFPNEEGGWDVYEPRPELGRRIHRQVK